MSASAASRSTSSRPGRRCCSPPRSHSLVWRAARSPLQCDLGGLARARLHGDRRPLRADPAGLARRRRLGARDPLRRPARPDARRLLLPRPQHHALGARPQDRRRADPLRRRPSSPRGGSIDIYAVSLQTWRDSGVPGWFREQLGLEYRGLSGLPENWVYNPGDERPLRRLVSTLPQPARDGVPAARRDPRRGDVAARLALAALADGAARDRPALHVLADDDRRARRRPRRARLRASGAGGPSPPPWSSSRRRSSSSAPIRTSRPRRASRPRSSRSSGQADRRSRRAASPLDPGESSIDSHLDSLRDGHPDRRSIIRGATASATPA